MFYGGPTRHSTTRLTCHSKYTMSDDLSTSTTILQSVLDRLAPDYRAFVETQPATSRIPLYTIDLNSAFRQSLKLVPPLDLGQADYIPVGSTRTIQLGQFSVLVLTPEGERPSGGWPAFLFIHGGGWVLGTVETGKQFYSRACVGEPRPIQSLPTQGS